MGQCYLATEELEEAERHYAEAYDLFDRTVGKHSPLFGMQAWACGNLRCAQRRFREALPFLGEALLVEAVSDGLSVSEMAKLTDQMLVCLHELRPEGLRGEDGAAGPALRALEALTGDPRFQALEDSLPLAVLCHKAALLHVAARNVGEAGAFSAPGGLAERILSERALAVLRQRRGDREAERWLSQAEAVHTAIFGP